MVLTGVWCKVSTSIFKKSLKDFWNIFLAVCVSILTLMHLLFIVTYTVIQMSDDIAEWTGMKINELAAATEDCDHWRGILRAANLIEDGLEQRRYSYTLLNCIRLQWVGLYEKINAELKHTTILLMTDLIFLCQLLFCDVSLNTKMS